MQSAGDAVTTTEPDPVSLAHGIAVAALDAAAEALHAREYEAAMRAARIAVDAIAAITYGQRV